MTTSMPGHGGGYPQQPPGAPGYPPGAPGYPPGATGFPPVPPGFPPGGYPHQGGFPPGGRPPRRSRTGVILVAVIGVVVLILAALVVIGTGDEPASNDQNQSSPSSGVLVASVADMRQAAIRIESVGVFREPDEGFFQATGTGSGFIIDPSGIAVTNNHVVAGSTELTVFIGGSPRPVRASILGVSECSDLAVIKIDGDDFPYVQWFDGAVTPPLEVFAAGFPLGDPEFTLTKGIVAKARADGDSSFASVTHVIEHDANIQPGNSGGALVTADAEVVAVNYATADVTNQRQFFAIASTVARPIVDRLASGEDVDSIGINGRAQQFRTGSVGIWVSGVTPGSPASRAGLQAGDVITEFGGVPMAEDGTMAAYCNVLRSQSGSRPISMTVERWDTDEILVGELNGSGLQVVSNLGMSKDPQDAEADVEMPQGFVQVVDSTGRVSVAVPSTWTDVDIRPRTLEGDLLPSITASTDIVRAEGYWDTPAITVTLVDGVFDLEAVRADSMPSDCTYERAADYRSPGLVGVLDIYRNCGGTATSSYRFILSDVDERFVVLAEVQLTENDSIDVLTQFVNTLQIR